MSIELENPKGILGKVDAAANYVAQIRIALMVGDGIRAMGAVQQAERLLFNATEQISELPADWSEDSSLETWFPLTAETVEKLRATVDQLKVALRRLWSGVVEMQKDARTDYELPRLAQLDLQSMTDQQDAVLAALLGGGGAERQGDASCAAEKETNVRLTDGGEAQ